LDPEPPQPSLLFAALTLLPAFFAAGYGIVNATAANLSSARKVALRDTLEGGDRGAMDRFLLYQQKLETRWLIGRVAGVAATAALLAWHLGPTMRYAWLYGWVAGVAAYAIPTEFAQQFTRPRAERVLPGLLRVIRVGEWLVAPFADPLYYLGRQTSGSSQSLTPSASLTETEVELLVNEGELNGSLDHEQSEMIRNVLDFGELTAEELMVPRTQVDAISEAQTIEEVMAEASRSHHSRYPVFSGSIDHVVGILHVKDLFHAMVEGLGGKTALELARRPVAFVPEGQLASTVLKEMRAGRHHMAVVLDEFGGVAGILTLEDLLEEIVGDIQDEHDADDAARIKLVGPHCAIVDASTPVADVNRALGTELPEEGDYVSLGGLLLEHLHTVPPQGSTHEVLGLTVVIQEADEKRISQVQLSDVPGVARPLSSHPPEDA
jgi:CBS domain containing-hemolysin-like protein